MKISKIFHSLYFMVMFLPLFIIPIFAININQKEVEPISITTGAWEFHNKYETNEVNSWDDLQVNKLYHYDSISGVQTYGDGWTFTLMIVNCESLVLDGNYQYYTDELYFESINTDSLPIPFCFIDDDPMYLNIQFMNSESYISINIENAIVDFDNVDFYFENQTNINNFKYWATDNNYTYPQESELEVVEYVYNEGHVYNNTDIGSQFLYSLYKPVHDYFNFGQYFGLNGVYDWFQVHFFNGTAPLPFFIFWNLLVYWLIISLLWLIFDVLIYVPMYIHRWLDKGALE